MVRKFAHIISGQFYSQKHTDDFTLFHATHDGTPTIPLNVAWNAGSVTSSFAKNPNYRLYTVEPQTFEVIDFDTYSFNLTAANLTPDQPPKWYKEYSFRDAFGVSDLSPYTLNKLVNETRWHDRQSLYKVGNIAHFIKFYYFLNFFFNFCGRCGLFIGYNDNCLEQLRQTINGDLF